MATPNGVLIPDGGGDPIPLRRPVLVVGRRERCDICLRFPNISSKHCELAFKDGYWVVRDLDSTNGIKVNGNRLRYRPLRPGDVLTIGKRRYTIQYELHAESRTTLEAILNESEDLTAQTLMEKAGLVKSRPKYDFDDEDDEFADDDD
jgi:adenylate cyclase